MEDELFDHAIFWVLAPKLQLWLTQGNLNIMAIQLSEGKVQ